jgi:hypothetical protein
MMMLEDTSKLKKVLKGAEETRQEDKKEERE